MEIIDNKEKIRKISRQLKSEGRSVGLVATMGALHSGHLELIKKCKESCDVCIVSIFVNPKQFAPHEDFETYPRDLNSDANQAFESGADYIFTPGILDIYPTGYQTKIEVDVISKPFEGIERPHFFGGVATVCLKLFNITEPDHVFFGQKDYQQCLVIQRLIKDLDLDINFSMIPTAREPNGLAKSSRNVYLTPDIYKNSSILFIAMEDARKAIAEGEKRRKIINAIMHKRLRTVSNVNITYASSALAEDLSEPEEFLAGDQIVLLIAIHLGKIRLIDNSLIKVPSLQVF